MLPGDGDRTRARKCWRRLDQDVFCAGRGVDPAVGEDAGVERARWAPPPTPRSCMAPGRAPTVRPPPPMRHAVPVAIGR